MNCSQFRTKHVSFVDDTLSAAETDGMYAHIRTCPRCAKQDALVRRSLLLVRNLPSVQPSPDFLARLRYRIEELEPAHPGPASSFGVPGRALAALAAGIAAIGFVAYEAARHAAPRGEFQQPPVISASAPRPGPVLASPALVASVPTGIPVWPAVLMAGEAPLHFATLESSQSEAGR